MSEQPTPFLYEPREGRAQLIDQLRQPHKVVPFLGAGVSSGAGLELPGWKGFLNQMIDKHWDTLPENAEALRVRLHTDRLESVAKDIYQGHDDRQLLNDLKDVFGRPVPDGLTIQGLIPIIARYFTERLILTTNFDQLLEYYYRSLDLPSPIQYTTGLGFFSPDFDPEQLKTAWLCKLHGDLTDKGNLTLIEDHYNIRYGAPGSPSYDKLLVRALNKLYMTRSFLFLGASLDQDRTLDVFKDAEQIEQCPHPHFAFVTLEANPSNAEEPLKYRALMQSRRLNNAGIKAFIYEEKEENFAAVEHYLEQVFEEARSSQIIPQRGDSAGN